MSNKTPTNKATWFTTPTKCKAWTREPTSFHQLQTFALKFQQSYKQ